MHENDFDCEQLQNIARRPSAARLSGMTRHCWKCGWEWTLSGQPGRGESCPQCRSDLRVCLNCVSYDARAAHQCRDRRAEPVDEKHRSEENTSELQSHSFISYPVFC